MAFNLNELESPSPTDIMCQVWLKLAQWFWRRFFQFRQCIFAICSYIPLEMGMAFNLNELESPLPRVKFWHFEPSFVEIGQEVLEKNMKMWKVYSQTDRRTDEVRQAIIYAHVSFMLTWAKIEKKYGNLNSVAGYYCSCQNQQLRLDIYQKIHKLRLMIVIQAHISCDGVTTQIPLQKDKTDGDLSSRYNWNVLLQTIKKSY